MGRTPEEPIDVPKSYRELIKDAVAKAGGQEPAGKLAGVHQTTIGRYYNGTARPTYTTLMKMSRKLPGLPAPLVVVRDRNHAQWCELGALLQERAPEEFRKLLTSAANQARLVGISDDEWDGDPPPAPSPTEIAALNTVISNPLRTDRKRGIRRG